MRQRQSIQLINDELKKQVIRIEHTYGIKDFFFFQNLKGLSTTPVICKTFWTNKPIIKLITNFIIIKWNIKISA